MAKYKVRVQMIKKVGMGSRWITVEAGNERAAMMLAEAKAKAPPPTVVTATATEVRTTK
jgi:hypothetical protein